MEKYRWVLAFIPILGIYFVLRSTHEEISILDYYGLVFIGSALTQALSIFFIILLLFA